MSPPGKWKVPGERSALCIREGRGRRGGTGWPRGPSAAVSATSGPHAEGERGVRSEHLGVRMIGVKLPREPDSGEPCGRCGGSVTDQPVGDAHQVSSPAMCSHQDTRFVMIRLAALSAAACSFLRASARVMVPFHRLHLRCIRRVFARS